MRSWARWAALLALACGNTHSTPGSEPGGGGAQGAAAGSTAEGDSGSAGSSASGSSGAASASGGTAGAAGSSGGGASAGSASEGGQNAGSGNGGSANRNVEASITIYAPVFAAQTTSGGNISVRASFPLHSGAPEPTCQREVRGDCAINRCLNLLPTLGAREHVGTLTIDSAEAGVHVVATPDADGNYTTTGDGSFSGGEAIGIVASGGTRPAFSLNARFALLLLVSEPVAGPALATLATVTQPRSMPANLKWTRGAANVRFYAQTPIVPNQASGGYVGIACSWDSMLGEGTIDAAVLGAMPAGERVRLYTAWQAEVPTDRLTISIVAEAALPDRSARVELLLE